MFKKYTCRFDIYLIKYFQSGRKMVEVHKYVFPKKSI